MITDTDLEELRKKLNDHLTEIEGHDEILNALVVHLIRSIDADMVQLWFYGNALKKRKEAGD